LVQMNLNMLIMNYMNHLDGQTQKMNQSSYGKVSLSTKNEKGM